MALKAIVFSLDAVFAVLIALLFLAALTPVVSTTHANELRPVFLQRIASDALTVLDKEGKLAEALSKNNSDSSFAINLTNSLSELIPANASAQMKIRRFACNSTSCNGFVEESSGEFNLLIVRATEKKASSQSKRIFVKSTKNLSDLRFGIAYLEVWK